MSLLDTLKEWTRPELPVKPEILEREKRFNAEDSAREQWILDNTYLCPGDLKALVPMYKYSSDGFAYYKPSGKKGPAKKVTVSVEKKPNAALTRQEVERMLKLDLNSRGCNAGVFYTTYEKGNRLFAEAIPATVTCEE